MEKLTYKLEIEGYPYQRPRLSRNHVHNTPKYTQHKKDLALAILEKSIPKNNYEYIRIHFYFPYPESEPKKNRLDLAPMSRKYDIDNLIKSFMDALQMSKVIDNDVCICGVYAEKIFTVEKKGWIEFELE